MTRAQRRRDIQYFEKFKPRFGVEYTFVLNRDLKPSDVEIPMKNLGRQARRAREFNALSPDRRAYIHMSRKLRKGKPFMRQAHADGYGGAAEDMTHMFDGQLMNGVVVEIPTPPFRTIGQAERHYRKMMQVIKERQPDLVARRVERKKTVEYYYGTGGGHVHVEMPKAGMYRRQLMVDLIIYFYNRPWLTWVFNEFGDSENAEPLCQNMGVAEMMTAGGVLSVIKIAPGEELEIDDPIEARIISLLSQKNWALRFKPVTNSAGRTIKTMTAEFRFFDAPRSWRQSEDHIRFAHALYMHVLEKSTLTDDHRVKPVLPVGTDLERYKNDRAMVERDFRLTVKALGLSWRKYKKYMRNYDDRKRYGKL